MCWAHYWWCARETAVQPGIFCFASMSSVLREFLFAFASSLFCPAPTEHNIDIRCNESSASFIHSFHSSDSLPLRASSALSSVVFSKLGCAVPHRSQPKSNSRRPQGQRQQKAVEDAKSLEGREQILDVFLMSQLVSQNQ